MYESRPVSAALVAERTRTTRLLNRLRFAGVSAFFSLFVVLGGLLHFEAWAAPLPVFTLYWFVSGLIYVAGRHSARVATHLPWAIAFVDIPVIFFLQLAQFPTSNAGGVAGFTLGIYVMLVVLAALALGRKRIFLTAVVGAFFEVLLQAFADVSAGAMAATVIVMAMIAQACALASARMHALIAEAASAAEAKARQEKLAAIGELAGSIGHDLRTPLAAVSMAHDYLRTNLRVSSPELEEMMQIIEREVEHCLHVANGLLDFARERPLTRDPVTASTIVDDAVAAVRAASPMLRIESVIEEELPVLYVDRHLFRQALLNLLINAAEALPDDGSGWVRVSAFREQERIVVRVSDNGGGISPEHQEQIFDPLFTTKPRGTGFGLAVVRSIVERHGAELRLRSSLGHGSDFSICLASDNASKSL